MRVSEKQMKIPEEENRFFCCDHGFHRLLRGKRLSAINSGYWPVVSGKNSFPVKVFWVVVKIRVISFSGWVGFIQQIGRGFGFLFLPLLLLLPACQASTDQIITTQPGLQNLPPEPEIASSSPALDSPIATSRSVGVATKPRIEISEVPESESLVLGVTPESRATETPSPDFWKSMPVVPEIGPNVNQIYARGLSNGNDPRAFSKVGDCGASNAWFLGPFDQGEQFYTLGEHTYLQAMIEYFRGSFSRDSIATRNGFNAASALSPLWADPKQCQPGETPLACEYRLHNPSYVFIMLGTNDRWHLETFEENMREILEYSLDRGIIPIVATKADNLEGDESINRLLAQLSIEYEIPLWNFWLAVQSLPNAGLDKDGNHLTWGPVYFDDPEVMRTAWPVRNLTAMQALYAVWQAVTGSSIGTP
jgi:hypothetical protein